MLNKEYLIAIFKLSFFVLPINFWTFCENHDLCDSRLQSYGALNFLWFFSGTPCTCRSWHRWCWCRSQILLQTFLFEDILVSDVKKYSDTNTASCSTLASNLVLSTDCDRCNLLTVIVRCLRASVGRCESWTGGGPASYRSGHILV